MVMVVLAIVMALVVLAALSVVLGEDSRDGFGDVRTQPSW